MIFERGKFNPTPEKGDLIVGDGLAQIGVEEAIEQSEQKTWTVLCSDGKERNVIPRWLAEDEDNGTVEENFWWQDCASYAVPWWE